MKTWWRTLLANFVWMLMANLLYEAIHKLHALGQNVSGMIIDSLGIATLFAFAMSLFAEKAAEK